MRLAAQAKQGYYPAHPLAIAQIAKHLTLRPPDPNKKHDQCYALDPCAGKGWAIKELAEAIGLPEDHIYTVELDGGRSEECKALMPKHYHCGPAGFMGTQITAGSFGLVYCNPPFDDEISGGRREERAFTEHATRKLVPKGILVLVCPFTALNGNCQFVEFIDANYEDVCVYKFPDGEDEWGNSIRPYREIVVIGKKRGTALPRDAADEHGKLSQMQFRWRGYTDIEMLPPVGGVQPKGWNNGSPTYDREETIRQWEVPHSWKPNVFKKIAFTEQELDDLISNSPLNSMLDEVPIPPPNAPPLPLDKGHLGLILASGMLDGVVEGPHGVHVVRGSSHKVEYHNKEQSTCEEHPETGTVTQNDVFSQRMITVIRVVEQNGEIRTFSNEVKDEPEESDE